MVAKEATFFFLIILSPLALVSKTPTKPKELAAFLEEKEVNDPDGGKTPKEMLREKIATIKKLLDETNNPRVFPIALAALPEERQVNDADNRKPPKEEIKEKIAMIKKLLDDISSLAEICGESDPCQHYATLHSADRKITFNSYYHLCDRSIGPGWFRFKGAAGTSMPSSCPPSARCGTSGSGWLTGGHPSVADGKVNRTVCFHAVNSCCWESTIIQVKNCNSYYVYYLSGTPTCNLRYCGTD